MRFYVLASDYDNTLSTMGKVSPDVLEALHNLRRSGRGLILVTGRQLDDLLTVFLEHPIFDLIVAENGALIYDPKTEKTEPLGTPIPEAFANELERRSVPFSRGRGIINTHEPYHLKALEAIRDMGLELQVIFNKGEVMILPSSINKAVGLKAALDRMGFSEHNVVGIGDAENDHAFLRICEVSAAVENALPSLKYEVDYVTKGKDGAGVIDLIDNLLATDLQDITKLIRRHQIQIGQFQHDHREPIFMPAYGVNVLISGISGGGKTTFATGFVERLLKHGYQFCILDPEGDYQELEQVVVLGDAKNIPTLEEVGELLEKTTENCVISLYSIDFESRPSYFEQLFKILTELRTRKGRPHWIVVDEAHHLLPAERDTVKEFLPKDLEGMLFVTAYPEHLNKALLPNIDLLLAVGEDPQAILNYLADALDKEHPQLPVEKLKTGQAIAWWLKKDQEPLLFESLEPESEQRRHRRKYAEGELEPDRSFYFRGPEDKLNLRAKNLIDFLELAQGVDLDTWEYHLMRGDYSKWFRDIIKDRELTAEADRLANDNLPAEESRQQLIDLITDRYTKPA